MASDAAVRAGCAIGPATAAAAPAGARKQPAGKAKPQAALVSWNHVLALGDQAVVSAASFATTILIGRTNPEELGNYALATSLLVVGISIQEALITLPFAIRRRRETGDPTAHAGGALGQTGLVSSLMILTGVIATAAFFAAAKRNPTALVWAMAAAAPFVFLREFARRFAFAHLSMVQAFALDAVVVAGQLAGLGLLAWSGRLSAATAIAAIGAACAIPAALWWQANRTRFAVTASGLRAATRQSWRLGKWLVTSQVAISVQSYIAYWLLAFTLNTGATGVFAACLSIASCANPLINGLGNMLTPQAIITLNEGGLSKLRHQMRRDAVLLACAMGAFCAAMLLFGDDLLRFLYPGPAYLRQRDAMFILSLALLVSALGIPASNALASLERPRAIFWPVLAAAIVTTATTWLCAVRWGMTGAAYGLLIGNAVGTVGRWAAFGEVMRSDEGAARAGEDAADLARRVLRQAGATGDVQDCDLRKLDEGGEAAVYAARRHDGGPIWGGYAQVVVKLAKQHVDAARVANEFALLLRLHEELSGMRAHGWLVSAPTPLHLSHTPPALVMSAAPGQKLSRCLRRITKTQLQSATHAIASAVERHWRAGQVYGELCPDNILCDADHARLAFLDPGAPAIPFGQCPAEMAFAPASRDLGYLIFDTAVGIRISIGSPEQRRRAKQLAVGVVAACLGAAEARRDPGRFLEEIRACALAHLDVLAVGWSARGAWRALLRRIAARRIAAMIDRARTEWRQCGEGS